jgi:hypothetical protein
MFRCNSPILRTRSATGEPVLSPRRERIGVFRPEESVAEPSLCSAMKMDSSNKMSSHSRCSPNLRVSTSRLRGCGLNGQAALTDCNPRAINTYAEPTSKYRRICTYKKGCCKPLIISTYTKKGGWGIDYCYTVCEPKSSADARLGKRRWRHEPKSPAKQAW